jgi:hypothetical protein
MIIMVEIENLLKLHKNLQTKFDFFLGKILTSILFI